MGLETAAVKLKSQTNHHRACLSGPFYLPLSVMSTPLSMPSALYVVSQFDWNGFIIAPINRDKHWPHDGCCENTLSLPLAQFVIILFLAFFFFFSPAALLSVLWAACPNQFACASGICISKDLKCDGWNDCGDMSDEVKCSKFPFDPTTLFLMK